MGRSLFICNPHTPYHVTSRCINRDWFSQPMDDVWNIFSTNLYFVKHAFDLEITSFVLMTNHFHLLVRAPQANLSHAMQYFLNQTSRQLTSDSQRINNTFVQRFKRCQLDSFNYFLNTYKYIYQNPVRAKLVTRVEDYKYSTLPGKLGLINARIPCLDEKLFFDIEGTLKWLNEKPSDKHLVYMQKALHRNSFKYPRGISNKANPLENQLL